MSRLIVSAALTLSLSPASARAGASPTPARPNLLRRLVNQVSQVFSLASATPNLYTLRGGQKVMLGPGRVERLLDHETGFVKGPDYSNIDHPSDGEHLLMGSLVGGSERRLIDPQSGEPVGEAHHSLSVVDGRLQGRRSLFSKRYLVDPKTGVKLSAEYGHIAEVDGVLIGLEHRNDALSVRETRPGKSGVAAAILDANGKVTGQMLLKKASRHALSRATATDSVREMTGAAREDIKIDQIMRDGRTATVKYTTGTGRGTAHLWLTDHGNWLDEYGIH